MKFNYNKARELLTPGNWDSFLNRNNDFENKLNIGSCKGWCRLVRGNVKKKDSTYNNFYMLLSILPDRDVTFDLTIKPNNKGEIDVLDEYILQPYDLSCDSKGVKKFNAIMKELIELGIVIPENEEEKVYPKGE